MAATAINRDWSSAGNRLKWTYSAWVKRSGLGGDHNFFSAYVDAQNFCEIKFQGADQIQFQNKTSNSWTAELKTNRVFRDTNAWYHIVAVWDTGNATSGNRLRLYVNGVEETSFGTETQPAQDYASGQIQVGNNHFIGKLGSASGYFDGIISHVHFCDGYAYAASDFGETDATTGEWKIKTSPSVSYGTKGFWILKDGNSLTDQSPNSNNWGANTGTLTKTEDCPSNVFNTLNPLDKTYGSTGTFSNGNTTQNQTGQSGHHPFYTSTLGFSSGKYYWEMKCVSGHSDNWYATGITSTICTANNNWLGQNANSYSIYGYSYGGGLGSSYTGGTKTNQGLSFTAGDIIGCAVDCDNLAIYWSKNGVWMSNASSVQGVPSSGSSKTGSFYTITAPSSTDTGVYFPSVCYYDYQNAVQQMNFGNGYFGTTAVSSAGSNASGIGIFEYDVPTGYTALSTKGLNL